MLTVVSLPDCPFEAGATAQRLSGIETTTRERCLSKIKL